MPYVVHGDSDQHKEENVVKMCSKTSEACKRCQKTIMLAEPRAMLECSLRSYAADKEDTIEVAHAVGFAPLCRTCGEQLQFTSPVVSQGTKILRYGQAMPKIMRASAALPALPALSLVSPSEGELWTVEHCWGCWSRLREQTNWLDVSLIYEREYWNATWERAEAEVLDYYATVSLCQSCRRQIPLAPLTGDVALATQWVAACVRLLEQQ
jgi:hypothetical protein